MSEGHRMFDDLLKIPLVMTGPNVPCNNIVKKMIRQVDIFPSILNLISLPSPNNIDGENIFSFWIRSVFTGYISAWNIEFSRLKRLKKFKFSFVKYSPLLIICEI